MHWSIFFLFFCMRQVFGQIISSCVHIGVVSLLLSTIKNFCEPDKLPKGSPWTCPFERIEFDNIVQMGVIGPAELFVPHGLYWWTYIFFIVGIIATVAVWKISRSYPHAKWIQDISVPLLLFAPLNILPTGPAHHWSWAAIGLFFNFYVFRRHKEWWAKYNYVLSAALSVGPAFLAFLQSIALQFNGINGLNWWGLELGDHCSLATCPTAKGIVVEGCPVFHWRWCWKASVVVGPSIFHSSISLLFFFWLVMSCLLQFLCFFFLVE